MKIEPLCTLAIFICIIGHIHYVFSNQLIAADVVFEAQVVMVLQHLGCR